MARGEADTSPETDDLRHDEDDLPPEGPLRRSGCGSDRGTLILCPRTTQGSTDSQATQQLAKTISHSEIEWEKPSPH
jgi:hypothetical protein